VSNAKAIDLTSKGNGNAHQLGTTVQVNSAYGIATLPPTTGVGVQAILNSDVRSKAKPEVGGKFNYSKYKDIFTKGDLGLAALFGTSSAAWTGKGPDGKAIGNNNFSGAGAVALNIVHHTVEAATGKSAVGVAPDASTKVHIESEHDVEVLAQTSQKAQLIAQ